MKNPYALAALLLVPAVGKAQHVHRPAAPHSAEQVKQELIAIEQEAARAAGDKAATRKLLYRYATEDYISTGPHGSVKTRDQSAADIDNNSDRIERTEISDLDVRLYGNTAVVTGIASERGHRHTGEAYVEEWRWMDIFVRRDGSWKVSVSHATLLPAQTRN